MKKYLICECSDNFCKPLKIVENFEKYFGVGYDIYEILNNGELELIKKYNQDYTKYVLYVCK